MTMATTMTIERMTLMVMLTMMMIMMTMTTTTMMMMIMMTTTTTMVMMTMMMLMTTTTTMMMMTMMTVLVTAMITIPGWNDVGWHNPAIQTPNLDQFAREGVILNSSYVQYYCSP